MPILAENKHPSVHFFLHRPRLLYLLTEKLWVRFVGNGHQSGDSRADEIKNDKNKRSKKFPQEENTKKCGKFDIKYGKESL